MKSIFCVSADHRALCRWAGETAKFRLGAVVIIRCAVFWLVKPMVGHDGFDPRSVREIKREHQLDELFAFAGDLLELGPREIELRLFVENALGSLALVERHLAGHEDVEDDADRPHVGLFRVVGVAFKNFGSCVRF